MLGALLSLASAAFFGLNNATLRRGVVKGTVLQAMAITVPFGVPMFVVIAAFMGGFGAMANWTVGPWIWMILAGIMHFVVGRYGNYKATQLLGSTLSTPIQQLSIPIALILAFLFIGETISLLNLVGIALIVFGPMVVVGKRKTTTKASAAKAFTPNYSGGLFWGLVCAVGYGTSPLFVAMGIGAGGITDSVAGLLVSYTAATVVVVIMIMASGGPKLLVSLDRGTSAWFLVSAFCVALSQLFRYMALAIAPVAVVVPVQRLSVVFRLLFNAILNRKYEVFDRMVVASILLSVIGAAAVAVDSFTIMEWLNLDTKYNWIARPMF